MNPYKLIVKDLPNIMVYMTLLLLGIKYFFNGFRQLREKRLLENTPTSTVRGLAMGLVELTGKAKKIKPLQSPFTRIECVYYRYTIEQYRNRGNSSHWEVIAKGDSNYCPFWLDDGTGKIMVFPQGAELNLPVNYEFQTGLGKSLPNNIVFFMMRNGLEYSGLFGEYRLRFKEWFVLPDHPVCVLGTAKKASDPVSEHKKKLVQRLEEIKHDPLQMRKADVNHDGDISSEEWDSIVKNVEQELLDEELKTNPQDCPTDVCIGQEAGRAFIISNECRTQLTTSFDQKVVLRVLGGAILSLLMLELILYALMYDGVFRKGG